jgi:MinD superfamily P-loop ATPase
VKQLKIPCGVVINRADLGNNSVHEYAAPNNLLILLEIPFSKKIAELYSRGLLLVEAEPGWTATFEELFRTITDYAAMARIKA